MGHYINNVIDHPEQAKDPNNIEFVKLGESILRNMMEIIETRLMESY